MAGRQRRSKYAPLEVGGPAAEPGGAGAARLPWAKVLCVYVITFGDLVSLQIFAPFMPEMVRVRFGLGEADAAVAVGVVQSTFNVFNFGGALLFGYASDHLGRKQLIQGGLCLTAGVTLALPFCRALWQVVAVRAVAGLFSATFALSKASLADLTRPLSASAEAHAAVAAAAAAAGGASRPRDHRRALAFAYHGAVAGLSRAFSSAIGGVATGAPFPGLVDEPYFVPCLVSAAMLGVGLVASGFLPETRGQAPEEKLSLGNLRRGLAAVAQDTRLVRLFACNALNHAGNGGLLTAGVLFLTLPVDHGGQGMSVYEAGMTFMAFGLFAVAFQLACFPVLNRWLAPRSFYLVGCASLASGVFLTPVTAIHVLRRPADFGELDRRTMAFLAAGWTLIAITAIVLCAVGFMACLPVLNTIIANQTRDDAQGFVSGLSTATGFLARSAGPVGAGALIAWGVTAGAGAWPCYLATGCAYVACAAIALTLTHPEDDRAAHYVAPSDAYPDLASSGDDDDQEDDDQEDDEDEDDEDEDEGV